MIHAVTSGMVGSQPAQVPGAIDPADRAHIARAQRRKSANQGLVDAQNGRVLLNERFEHGKNWRQTSGDGDVGGGTTQVEVEPGDRFHFRMHTRFDEFRDMGVTVQLRANEWMPEAESELSGAHLMLRRQTDKLLYYVTLAASDGRLTVSKKVPDNSPDAPSHGGKYHTIAKAAKPIVPPIGEWFSITATVRDRPDGSVAFQVYRGAQLVAEGVDDGIGGPPIREGAVGLRSDRADVTFDTVTVVELPPS